MFSCRLLFCRPNIYIATDKLSVSCKCTASGKPTNVLKTFNTENKHLFGGLLESKTKRRKVLSKATVTPAATTELIHNEAPKKKRKSKKTKDIETLKTLSDNSPSGSSLDNHLCEDHLKRDKGPQNEESSTVLLDKSILKTAVTVNENSCPLNNADKLDNTTDLQNKTPMTVMTDQFIAKSAVPVNENSFPIDNPNKLEFSIHGYCMENVLNYGFTDPLVKQYMKFPSVSKIMDDTMSPTSRMVLNKWRKNMVADMGEEGFEKHCAALKERGHEFHEAVRNTVLGRSSEGCHSEITRNALRSLEWVLGLVTNPLAVESIIAHPHLQYKGIPDCVAMFRGVPVVIDWKLSEKPKKDLKDTYDAPVQITAYMGALNHDPNYKWKVSHGLVAVAYTSGDPSDVFLLAPKHCEIYWRHWLLRFYKFNARSHLHTDHQIDEKALESV